MKAELQRRMQQASEAMEFETAARYRDRLAALSAVSASQDINTQGVEEADVFAIDEQAGQFCCEIFFFRNFQNWGNRALFPRADRHTPIAEVLASVIAQFYDDKPAPRLVLLSHEIEDMALLQSALSDRMGFRVELSAPRRGEKRVLVDLALKNAREALSRKLADTAGQAKLLGALGAAFGLSRPPRRVEVYDNSHIMGTNAVGAMIVAGPDGFMKQHYRTFNIGADTTAGDDYGMMREVLTRRFGKIAKERAENPLPALPHEGQGARATPHGRTPAKAPTAEAARLPPPSWGRAGRGHAAPMRTVTKPSPPPPTSSSWTAARASSRRRAW